MLEWLQQWYIDHCDGEWEHENGVAITTIDNPGWSLTIDLRNTKLEDLTVAYTLDERSDDDWIGYSIEKKVFKAVGGTHKLSAMIEVFKKIFESEPDIPHVL